MKRLFFLCVLFSILISCNSQAPKVLLYIRDGSYELEYMLAHEVGTMTEILKQSGFEVITATISGAVIKTDSITLTPNLKLGEVNIDDYAGFILPCMSAGITVNSEEIAFVKNVVSKNKPIAVQCAAVLILAKAGVLSGKKFAFPDEEDWNIKIAPEFTDGIFSGNDVIQDGIIITSGTCPAMAKKTGHQDSTAGLTKALVETIKVRAK